MIQFAFRISQGSVAVRLVEADLPIAHVAVDRCGKDAQVRKDDFLADARCCAEGRCRSST